MLFAVACVSAGMVFGQPPAVSSAAHPVSLVPAIMRDTQVAAPSVALLTDSTLVQYIAVKKALATYWPAHQSLLKTAQANGHSPVVSVGSQQLKVGVFDYSSLVKQDTALATLFSSAHFAAAQFEPTQVAVYGALLSIVLHDAAGTALPAATSVEGKNVTLVQANRDALKAVGVNLQVQKAGGMGGMGGGNDLNP